jgi:hypothetical protein
MNNHDFKQLLNQLEDSGVNVTEVLQEAAYLAALVYAEGADLHTVGQQFIDSAEGHLQAEWDKISDEPTESEIKAELNRDADREGIH